MSRPAPARAAGPSTALRAVPLPIAFGDREDQGVRLTRATGSAFDAGEIGDLVDGVAHPGEESEAALALGLVGVIHRNLVEERIHGRAEGGQRRHRALELLRLDRGAGTGLGRIE